MPNSDYQEKIYTEDIEDLIEAIVRRFNRPYSEDITDQVFLTIENDLNLLRRYELYAGQNKGTANQLIGKLVKAYTGLKVKGTCRNPRSTLIKSYTKLG